VEILDSIPNFCHDEGEMVKKTIVLSIAFIFLFKGISVHNDTVLDTNTDSVRSQVLSAHTETVASTAGPLVFASLPSFDQHVKTSVKTADARAEIIRQYLIKYSSPLVPYSELIVELSDIYNFDYRWLVAIAQQESNLCKKIPIDSYNCWGWGIYPDPANPEVLKVTRFESYDDALRRIAPQFTKIFLKGSHSKDPAEVMKTYTPPSDGSWAESVNYFFDKLE